jgi:hypothetical protein
MIDRLQRVRRGVLVLAACAALWAPLVVLTGGFSVRLGPLSISSRNPRNAVLIVLVLMAVAWTLAPRGARTAAVGADLLWQWEEMRTRSLRVWRRWISIEAAIMAGPREAYAASAATAVALMVVLVGFREGAFVAAASDAWGYVSQAELWAQGDLHVEQPLMRELTAQVPAEALAPLAYRPSVDRSTIVPVVAPGLPLLMALFQVVAGREAVFAVVPLMAGVAVIGTYLIGKHLHGPWTGVAAAALLAASPSFLFQLTSSPMSDIPATAWWAVSLGLLLIGTPRSALASGAAAGAAILTRSNLAPLALVPVTLLLVRARSAHHSGREWRSLALFVAGILPACLFIAWLNTYWYGSPLSSGYGSLEEIYDVRHVAANLERYPRWLLESQTGFVLLALVAPWLVRRRAEALALLAFAGAVLACYLAYVPFDAWWFLRFLLPGYPALLVLSAAPLSIIVMRLPAGLRVAAATFVVGAVAWHGVTYAAGHATFTSEGELKYAVAGRYVEGHLPDSAVLLAVQHSGSARYYSRRVTIRWDWIPPEKLEWMLGEVRRAGYQPYALVEDWEVPALVERFRGQPSIAALERPPLVELPLGHVRVYRLD